MVKCGMTCPLCRRPTVWEANPWRPFCSERCQIVDLGTWAAEQYRLPGPKLSIDICTEAKEESQSQPGHQSNG
jgi:endogenous inhibitor of DNA gyrase (YacG/DUF329 family)